MIFNFFIIPQVQFKYELILKFEFAIDMSDVLANEMNLPTNATLTIEIQSQTNSKVNFKPMIVFY